jgi:hypothetical protein
MHFVICRDCGGQSLVRCVRGGSLPGGEGSGYDVVACFLPSVTSLQYQDRMTWLAIRMVYLERDCV